MKRIIIIIMCLALMGVVVSCGNSVETNTDPNLVYTDVAKTVIAEFTQEAKKIEVSEIIEPTSEPTNTPEIGTRENPVSFTQPMPLVYNEAANIEIRVLSVIRGQEAFQRILNENQFNDPPLEGMEYILINIGIDYLTSDQTDLLIEIDSYDFKVVSNNQLFSWSVVITPEPELNVSLFPGGHGEGLVVLSVYIDDPNPLVVFNKYLDDNMFYFSIY